MKMNKLKGIRELVEKYRLSGDPIHLNLIYFNYGLEGALYLGKFDVASTMIKKQPKYINSSSISNEEKKIIFKRLTNDLKSKIADEKNNPQDDGVYEEIRMLIDIAKEIKISMSSHKMDVGFLFDVYNFYCDSVVKDLHLIKNIILCNQLEFNQIIETFFYKEKNVIRNMIEELNEILTTVLPIDDVYYDILRFAIRVYIKLYDEGNDELMTSIETAICKSIKHISTPGIIRVLEMIRTIRRIAPQYIDETIQDVDDSVYELESKFQDRLTNYIKGEVNNYLEDFYDDYDMESIEIELSYADGLERVALFKYMNDNIHDSYAQRFYDVEDERALLKRINYEEV